MLDVFIDTILDTLKIIPFLFLAYIVIEVLERKAGEKTVNLIQNSGKFGPIIGGLLGSFPQCGFSAAAANLYAGRIITMGTLISIFLSTSDEMLPILISESVPAVEIMKILLIKIIIGIIAGFCIDILFRKKFKEDSKQEIHKLCDEEHCHCEEQGVFKSALIHTLHILIYIFIVSLVLNIVIELIGEDAIASLILNVPVLGVVISSLIGIIPNCATSVILTKLYVENIITVGSMISGLLVNSGIGILVLFKVNKKVKENVAILGILLFVGIVSGGILDLII